MDAERGGRPKRVRTPTSNRTRQTQGSGLRSRHAAARVQSAEPHLVRGQLCGSSAVPAGTLPKESSS
eukprot:scaffold1105_cov140-Isochrysis_galbana.AAC.2